VPKSRVRRKAAYVPPPAKVNPASRVSPPWLVPMMVACFVLGLAWIVVYYLAGSSVGVISALGAWNLLIGFGLLAGGFALASRWR